MRGNGGTICILNDTRQVTVPAICLKAL
jgi:hypothetical protein